MKHHLPPLDTLKAFEAAARHLSFSLAADELCITKSAVSYQIRKLEGLVQCNLFKRSVRQVYLTDAGQALLKTTQKLFQELGDTLLRLQGETQQAGVSIAATTYVAARWLSTRISQFNDHHPNVNILLQHAVNSADFKLGEVDLAIRWGPCRGRTDRNRFGEIAMPLYPAVSPQLLQRHGIKDSRTLSADLLSHPLFKQLPLLCEDRQQDLWQEWFSSSQAATAANGSNNTRTMTTLDNPRRIISDANVRVQAAVDGQGLILADDLMANELNNGLLIAPFTEKLTGYGYALMCSPTRIHNNNAHALKDWLSASTLVTQ